MIARMGLLPHKLYRAAEVRALERMAIETLSIEGIELMNRAGAAAFAALRACWPAAKRVTVVCGGGNNGGDGFVLARLADEAKLQVSVVMLVKAASLKDEAKLAYDAMVAVGVEAVGGEALSLVDADVVVDALLGTGLDREVTGRWRETISMINTAPVPVFSIDIPSGLNGDSGAVMGAAICADATISFIALKQGMLTASGVDCCGQLFFDALQLPTAVYEKVAPSANRILPNQFSAYLPRRMRATHKGDCGHLLVVGGAAGMSGAPRMAGEAALRCGAGLVSIATVAEHAAGLNFVRPELMVHAVETLAELSPLIAQADVIAVGPGLGCSKWGMAMFAAVLASDAPLVVDADALNLLAIEPYERDDWVLTPHPGEAARLLNISTDEVQADRFAAADALQRKYGGVTVLKGCGSLVADQDGAVSLCDAGNPGMASGGMGDLLTGVIAALIAQGVALADAARFGVWLHATAADRAAVGGERGMLASDLLPHLRKLVNHV